MKLISIIGSNATGKSTRVTHIIDSLGEIYTPLLIEGKEFGRIYDSGYCVIGKRTKSGKWNSMDSFPHTNWDTRLAFFEELAKDERIHTVIMEGYFNMVAKAGNISVWKDHGYDEVEYFFFYYDKVEDFLARVNMRNEGKDIIKTMEWAKGCAGWKDNEGRIKKGCVTNVGLSTETERCVRLDIDTDEYFFVDHLGLPRGQKFVPESQPVAETSSLEDFF